MKPIVIPAPPAPAKNVVKPQPTIPPFGNGCGIEIASWPDDKSAPSEGEDWDAVQQHFAPGLSRDEFRNVRREETPPEWRKQGPRKPWPQVKD